MRFYEAIEEAALRGECRTVTVLDGPSAGEQAVLLNGDLFWISAEDGSLNRILNRAGEGPEDLCEAGICDLEGSRVYTDLIGRRKKMVICGAGHVSLPLIRIAGLIGFHVTVIEDRAEFAADAEKAGADAVICAPFETALEVIRGDGDTFFIVVTRAHQWDRLCLRSILRKPHAYVGMMGSGKRTRLVRDRLKEEGFDPSLVDSVHAPIGLEIGAQTPEEIAVSIMAEVVRVKNESRTISIPEDILRALNGGHGKEPLPGRKIMATIIAREGSTPREAGTRMLFFEDGTRVSTIGGGVTEAVITSRVRDLFLQEKAAREILHVDLNAGWAAAEGEICGGAIDVLLQEV